MHFFAALHYELQLIIAANTGQSYPSKCTPAPARSPEQSKGVRQSSSMRRRNPPRTKRTGDSTDVGEAVKRLVIESGQPSRPGDPLDDDELQRPYSEHGPIPELNYVPATSQPCRDDAFPCSSSSSFDVPHTPKLRTRDLLDSPSIVISPLHSLPLPSSLPADPARAVTGADFDPFYDDPLLHPLAEDWSSLDRGTSLSLVQEPSDDDWPYSNALGLYVDPSINVSTWDCGGFIRSTVPSPSPTWVARNRRHYSSPTAQY